MKSTQVRTGSGFRRVAIAALVALAFAAPSMGQSPAKKGTIEHIKVRGAALVGNLQGESPERDVFIYLPPGYAANRNQRYPVVYLLHGYSLTAERWMDFTKLGEVADRDIAAGTKRTAGAGNDHHPHISVTAGVLQGFGQIAAHMTGKCIQLLGTIQSDRRDSVVFSDVDHKCEGEGGKGKG